MNCCSRLGSPDLADWVVPDLALGDPLGWGEIRNHPADGWLGVPVAVCAGAGGCPAPG